MNPVNSGSGVGNNGQTPASGQTSGTPSSNQVSQGYSGTNSVSSTGGSSGPASISANLPKPEVVKVAVGEFVSQSLNAQIDARLSNIRNNLKIDASDVYLGDTDTLFLMIKGFVDELVAVASMQSISQAFGTHQQAQSTRAGKAKKTLALQARIQERQGNIQEKNNQLNDYSSSLAKQRLTRSLKEHQLANAKEEQASGGDRSGDIATLNKELSLLEHKIANAEEGISELQQDVKELKGLNTTDQASISSYQRALNVVREELVNVGSLVTQARQRFDNEALHTGEENVEEVKEAAKEVSLDARREETRLKVQKDLSRDLDKSARRQEIKRADDALEAKLYGSQLSFLPPSEAAVLKAVFGSIDFDKLQAALGETPAALDELRDKKVDKTKAASDKLAETELDETKATSDKLAETEVDKTKAASIQPERPPFDEGLAIVLQSAVDESSETAQKKLSEEEEINPAASTFGGDNLSFEGAKNPLIFAGLWLQAQMEQGEATQAAKEGHLEDGKEAVVQTEQLQKQTFADALQDFATIPEETARSLDEGQQAEADISRRSPV
ncbi:coiled-coil domain-containing protein [Endozoicomonas euniceicola]|uniref:Uncharacterized protein n=1 Tax=Endozoicomonas euniceicola TaxID=1234143 RepID=A0ABY6GVM1_9GAMM|nr:hypothetical protein [Endozoicomonas euniceicola]UYM16814.1 hypothetical protein NX720_02490 [Endozoicomonas euniceicola]